MSREAALSPVLRRALRPTSARCYRHCGRPVRGRTIRAPGPGWLCVYACPGGAVSVTTYTERTLRDPTPTLQRFARSRTSPPSLVRRWDLRLATRHGPELGRNAERLLARAHPSRPVRTVYWRRYPYRSADARAWRLFACFRHGAGTVRFFVAPAEAESPRCPKCPRPNAGGRRKRRPGLTTGAR
jgi:hypothetical protein